MYRKKRKKSQKPPVLSYFLHLTKSTLILLPQDGLSKTVVFSNKTIVSIIVLFCLSFGGLTRGLIFAANQIQHVVIVKFAKKENQRLVLGNELLNYYLSEILTQIYCNPNKKSVDENSDAGIYQGRSGYL